MKNLISFKNKKIHYSDEGNGNCLVLLHGFLESLEIWDVLVNDLIKKYRVVRIDLPGHGKSDSVDETHSMSLMAEAVNTVLGFLNISQTIMIGHSMGGYVTLQYAESYPEKLKGFGLFHSHAAADSAEAKKNRDRTIEIVNQNHKGFISNFIPDLFAEENLPLFANEIENLKRTALQTKKEGIIAALKGMKDRTSKIDLLQQTSLPVLFILGKKDKRIPINDMKEQIILPILADILIMGETGHMGYIEAQHQSLIAIKSFLAKVYIK